MYLQDKLSANKWSTNKWRGCALFYFIFTCVLLPYSAIFYANIYLHIKIFISYLYKFNTIGMDCTACKLTTLLHNYEQFFANTNMTVLCPASFNVNLSIYVHACNCFSDCTPYELLFWHIFKILMVNWTQQFFVHKALNKILRSIKYNNTKYLVNTGLVSSEATRS